jgi:nitrite reductase/ring-hydroxylating ferredoxin subunit
MNAYPKIIFSTFLFLFLSIGCKKSELNKNFPNVPVNLTIYLSTYPYTQLNSIGNHVYVSNAGYRGIVIYRKSLDEFAAFDRGCPYDPTVTGSLLEADGSGLIMADAKCGSKFSLYDGSIVNGPSTSPMKAYHVDYNSTSGTLLIYN